MIYSLSFLFSNSIKQRVGSGSTFFFIFLHQLLRCYLELRQSPEFYKKYPDFWPVKNYLNHLTELCKNAVDAGRIRKIDPELLTTIIFGSLDFTITTWLLSKSNIDMKHIKEGVADIIYRGLEPREV